MATALVVLAGVILTGVVTIIVSQRNGRQEDRRVREQEHSQNATRLDTIAGQTADVAWRVWQVQQQLPPGGLGQWVETVSQNTEALKQHGQALEHTAATLATLSKRVDAHEDTLRTLTAGTPTV